MLNISEIFHSIQGEGLMAGLPAMFIRLSGEAPPGTWCDTPPNSFKPEGMDVYMGALLTAVRRQYCGHAVVTGREPMAHPDIELLCEGLRGIDHHITIETNGTVFKKVECDLMSISPKLKSSIPAKKVKVKGKIVEKVEEISYEPEIVKQLMETYNYQLKFMLSDRANMEEVKAIVDELRPDRSRVLLTPAGTKPKELRDRSEWMMEACKFFNYRYSPRLQLQVWGNKRRFSTLRRLSSTVKEEDSIVEVQFTDDQKAFVRQAIESGRYSREEDALREALSLWEGRERRRVEILAAVDQAEASFARGEGRRITTREQALELADQIKRRNMARLATEGDTR